MTSTPVATTGRLTALPTTATIDALGVVHGNMVTSPLHALEETAKAVSHHGGGTFK